MKRIAGILKVERRVAPRVPVRIRVLYVVGGCVLDATTIDISEQGMCLQTGVDLEVGTELLLHLEPRPNLEAPRIQARVMWVKPDASGGEEQFTCGLRFDAMAPEIVAQVREIIAAHDEQESGDLPEAAPTDVVEVAPPVPAKSLPVALKEAVGLDHGQRAVDVRHAESFLRRGKEAVQRGDLQDAVTLLEQAVEQMPDSEDAVEELARVLYLQGDVVRAATLFDRALRVRQEKR